MEYLKVGEPDCTFNDVCKIMFDSPAIGTLIEKWKELARRLGISEHDIEQLQSLTILDKVERKDVIVKVLEKWRAMKSGEATLAVLVCELEEMELKDVADTLKDRFVGDASSECTSKPAFQRPPVTVNEWITTGCSQGQSASCPNPTVTEHNYSESVIIDHSFDNRPRVPDVEAPYCLPRPRPKKSDDGCDMACSPRIVTVIVVAATVLLLPLVLYFSLRRRH